MKSPRWSFSQLQKHIINCHSVRLIENEDIDKSHLSEDEHMRGEEEVIDITANEQ